MVAPLLADYVFKPGMVKGGALASILGPVVGVGANHGVGVLISVLGLLSIVVSVLALLNRHIRNVEIDLPDQVATPAPEAGAGQSDLPA